MTKTPEEEERWAQVLAEAKHSDELRELDAEIAVHVMGWRWAKETAGRYGEQWRLVDPERAGEMLPEYVTANPPEGVRLEGRDGRCPHYSTDIAAAWQVVEKVIGDGGWIHLDYDRDYGIYHRCGWTASVCGKDRGIGSAHGHEFMPTAAEAICRSVLAAYQSEEQDE